jgi:hypothetical protein
MILLISSHIYVLIFKTYPSMTYICTTIGLYTISVDYRFFGWFPIFLKMTRQFSLDMSGSQVSRVYKGGLLTPYNPNSLVLFPLFLLRLQGDSKAILDLLHRIPSVFRGFASSTPCDLQTLVGFLSPKVFLRFLQDFFDSSSISFNA